jgi:glycosyltransferase involved in cell wall biosynthesis
VSYIIITAARNEDAFIGSVIESVLSQTVHPLAWVIVSDASTDGTDDIVKRYADGCSWIRYLRRDVRSERNFANKIHAFDLAYQQVKGVPFEFIGNLDADIVVAPTYYEGLLGRFVRDRKLGLASGFIDQLQCGEVILAGFRPPESVPHGAQLVRRTCFEQIGGYLPLEDGGEDWCAQVSARMLGWNASSFPEIRATELRDAAGEGPVLARRIKEGRMDYSMGCLPAFELIKCMRRVRERPFVVGAMTRLSSYCLQSIRRPPRLVPREVIQSLRKEQRKRLWGAFSRYLAFSRPDDRIIRKY